MPYVTQENQKLEPSAIISLFTLDTAKVGGPKLYFTMTSQTGGASIAFGGITYTPIDIEFRGLETTAVGALPTPSVVMSNTDPLVQVLITSYGDLNGCDVSRIRTYARFLDGQPEADSTAFMGPDRFRVERKSSDTPVEVEWELSASIDQEDKMLPGRVVIANTCLWRYRIWEPTKGSFNYSMAQCPYTGTDYFDANDDPVASAALDKPSRQLSCCKVRFGEKAPLPFGGFPGATRISG